MEDQKKEKDIISYIKLSFFLYLIYFTFILLTKKLEPVNAFIHNIDLPIHEFGHLLFGIVFGGIMTIIGGNLFEFIFPCIMAGSFYFRKDFFGGGFCTLWAGETLIDASYYIADARDRNLNLITGDPDTHDWFNILSEFNIIQYDTLLGKIAFFFGSILMISAIFILLFNLNKEFKFIEVKL